MLCNLAVTFLLVLISSTYCGKATKRGGRNDPGKLVATLCHYYSDGAMGCKECYEVARSHRSNHNSTLLPPCKSVQGIKRRNWTVEEGIIHGNPVIDTNSTKRITLASCAFYANNKTFTCVATRPQCANLTEIECANNTSWSSRYEGSISEGFRCVAPGEQRTTTQKYPSSPVTKFSFSYSSSKSTPEYSTKSSTFATQKLFFPTYPSTSSSTTASSTTSITTPTTTSTSTSTSSTSTKAATSTSTTRIISDFYSTFSATNATTTPTTTAASSPLTRSSTRHSRLFSSTTPWSSSSTTATVTNATTTIQLVSPTTPTSNNNFTLNATVVQTTNMSDFTENCTETSCTIFADTVKPTVESTNQTLVLLNETLPHGDRHGDVRSVLTFNSTFSNESTLVTFLPEKAITNATTTTMAPENATVVLFNTTRSHGFKVMLLEDEVLTPSHPTTTLSSVGTSVTESNMIVFHTFNSNKTSSFSPEPRKRQPLRRMY